MENKPYIDVVCGMKVSADPAKTVDYKSEKFHFCSQGCIDKFRGNPGQYLKSPEESSSHGTSNKPTESTKPAL